MSLRKTIANWLDPERDQMVEYAHARMREARDEHASLYESRDTYRRSNDNLVGKLADAASNITTLRADIRLLRHALLAARDYVMNAYDDAEADLNALPPKSKKRPALAAVKEAITLDLKTIADALAFSAETKPGTTQNANADQVTQ